jgi:WD40 repeat protein
VELWDTIGHKLAAVLPNTDPVYGLGFATDGKTLVVGGRGVSTSLWRINEPSVRTQVSGLAARPTSLAFRDDGLLAIGDGAGATWLWCDSLNPNHDPALPRNVCARPDPAEGPESASEPGASRDRDRDRDRFRSVALAFDARGDLISLDARGLNVWPARPKAPCEPTRLELPPSQGGGRFGLLAPPLARSGDGRALALTRGRSVFVWRSEAPGGLVPGVRTDESADDHANPWDVPRPGAPTGDAPRRGPGGPWAPRFQAVQLASTGDRLYLLDDAGTVQALKLQPEADGSIKADPLRWKHALPKHVAAVALRPDGRLLAVGDHVGAITLVDAASLAIVGQLRPEADEADEPEGPITALAFSPDGRGLAAGAQRGPIHFWSAPPSSTDYTHQYRLPSQCGRPSSIVFDAAGRKLAVGGVEPVVEVWDLAAFGDELRRLDLAD